MTSFREFLPNVECGVTHEIAYYNKKKETHISLKRKSQPRAIVIFCRILFDILISESVLLPCAPCGSTR